MELSMRVSLVGRRRVRFSKTARSGPRHHEAGRSDQGAGAPAVHRRRLADDVAEGSAERAQAVEANLAADVRHAAAGLAQQEHGALDAAALEIAVRCLPATR